MDKKAIVNIIDNTYEFQVYNENDIDLISKYSINQQFGAKEDTIEIGVYDINDQLIKYDYSAKEYYSTQINPKTNLLSDIILSPEKDLNNYGIDRGSFNINYKFFKNLFKSNSNTKFWISEISPDRTEIRLETTHLTDSELLNEYQEYESFIFNLGFYPDLYLNFGDNKILIGVNLGYSETSDGESSILIKLYKPLSSEFDIKNTLWLQYKISEPKSYNVSFEDVIESNTYQYSLKGPNFNVKDIQSVNQTTDFYNYNSLLTTTYNSSSFNQMKSILDEKGYEINIDYSNFSEFIHFSSATQRILNFKYKLELIESYKSDIASLGLITNNEVYVINTTNTLQKNINNIIEKFDGYEYYLYFESGSMSWPKYESQKPYTLYSVTSSQGESWLGGVDIIPTPLTASVLFLANEHDINNQDLFLNSIPEYLRDDSDNLPYELFLDMVGQHFDNIWIYYKDVSKRYDANNNLYKGISKDLVAEALKALGVKLYTNTNISNNLYYSILGYTEDGSLTPPTGSELITRYITSSIKGNSSEDLILETYKRIYHNIPYILKSKGTERGLRALINCYGIPDTILKINEFGGYKKEQYSSNYIDSRFALAYKNTYTENLRFPWAPSYYKSLVDGNSNIVPDTITFRFKSTGIPTSSAYYTQSLFSVLENTAGQTGSLQFGVRIQYDPSQSLENSPYEKYGNVSLILHGDAIITQSAEIFLPVFDSDMWWTAMIKRENGGLDGVNNSYDNTYWIYIKNAILNEEGIPEVGFEGSASIFVDGAGDPSYNAAWNNYNPAEVWSFNAFLGGANDTDSLVSPTNTNFDGYFQEFRYWAAPLDEEVFDVHVLNSLSYVGNGFNSSSLELIYRAPLGNNLTVPYKDQYEVIWNDKSYDLYLLGFTQLDDCVVIDSHHPAVTGSIYVESLGQTYSGIGSITNGTVPYSYGMFCDFNNHVFHGHTIVDLVNIPSIGISQKNNNKVFIDNFITSSNPFNNQLDLNISLNKFNDNITISTKEIEVGFSPANVIDEDIINQLGYFNIDDFIGGPSDQYEPNYQSLDQLRKQYLQKYYSHFEVIDFIRGIKYFDNSLFKMIQDFIPAKSGVSTGIIIKPTILERSKYKRNEPTAEDKTYTASIDMVSLEGGDAIDRGYDTSHSASIDTPSGSIIVFKNDNRELFTGEYGGSEINIINEPFTRIEISNNYDSANYLLISTSLNPLLNNISSSRYSTNKYVYDYTTSLAPVQDFNYNSKFYYRNGKINTIIAGNNQLVPKSKLISDAINEYNITDISYGKQPVVNSNQVYFAYVKNINKSNLLLPSRSNVEIKYLIDEEENVLDLTKFNNNIFSVQNTFKDGEKVNISLFDYSQKYAQKLNSDLEIFSSGFIYLPIMHNINSSSLLTYTFEPPYLSASLGSTPGIPASYTYTVAFGGTDKPAYVRTYYGTTYSDLPTTQWGEICSQNTPYVSLGTVQFIPGNPGITSAEIYYYDISGDIQSFSIQYVPQTFGPAIPSVAGDLYPQGYTLTGVLLSAIWSSGYDAVNLVNCVGAPCSNLEVYIKRTQTSSAESILLSGDLTLSSVQGSECIPASNSTTSFIYSEVSGSTISGCIQLASASISEYRRKLIKLHPTLSAAITDGLSPLFSSVSDSSWNSDTFNPIETPFSIELGDRIHFATTNSLSLKYQPDGEYIITDSIVSGSNIYLLLDREVSFTVASASSQYGDIDLCRYIIMKRIPDETNMVIKFNNVNTGSFEGNAYPKYLKENLRNLAGNIIKSLKNQNLI